MVGPSCIMHSALLRLQLLLIQTTAEATPPQTTTPAESLTEGLVRGWPADGTSEEWYKCNNCGWLPSTVGGVVQTMPQNHLGLTWHEACFWWCDQEPECVTAWHRKSGNHCSLYNFALPFDANNHPSSHMYVKPMPGSSTESQTTAEATPPQTTTPPESLTEGLVRGWPADGSSEEWYKCNNCGWLPSTVGGVVQTMPQNP